MAETSHANRDEEDDTGEWLNLSLATNVSKSSKKSKRVIQSKAYSCDYCTRTFSSPQALGGHQNGHKKERGEAREFLSQWLITRMCTPHYSTGRSLQVYTHSLVRLANMEYQFSEPKVPVSGGNNTMHDESTSVRWPGSFNDLDLRL